MSSVIIDTSVWAQYFRIPASPEGAEVRRLLEAGEAGEAVMVRIVYAELLRGARDDGQFTTLEEELDAVPFVDATRTTWSLAERILADLRRQGAVIPLADAAIVAVALENGFRVFTNDQHFQRISGLRLYEPDGGTGV